MRSHLRRVRALAGVGVGIGLSGLVVAVSGQPGAGRGLALAGAGLVLWESAARALARGYRGGNGAGGPPAAAP